MPSSLHSKLKAMEYSARILLRTNIIIKRQMNLPLNINIKHMQEFLLIQEPNGYKY